MNIPAIITPTSISILLDGRMRTIHSSHMNFSAVSDEIKFLSGIEIVPLGPPYATDRLRELLDIPSFISRVTEGRVQISNDTVLFDGQMVAGVIANRLLALLHEGHDVRPLARFLERLSGNVTTTARDEVYLFLESGNMPFTPDGCFLAFKKVNGDYSSSNVGPDGKPFMNHVGSIVSMPRETVDPNREQTCSRGLHFCSWSYLPQFGLGGESRVLIVKVAPEDVVSIPSDYNNSKGRAWKYAIIGEVPESECQHLFDNKSIVNAFGLYEADTDDDYADYSHTDDQVDSYTFTQFVDDDKADDACDCNSCKCPDPGPQPALSDLKFTHKNVTYSAQHVSDMVYSYGQRGFARASGVPRTTLQGWLSQAAKAGWVPPL